MTSPIRAQYLRLKQPHPDALLLFRLGDFYEIYDGDARVAARALDLTLTARDFGEGQRIGMCAVPYHAVEGQIKRLVAHGYKVAIAEQIGDPRTAKGLVEREVVRVVTPSSAVGGDHRAALPPNLVDASPLPRGTCDWTPPFASAAFADDMPREQGDSGERPAPEQISEPPVQLVLFDLSEEQTALSGVVSGPDDHRAR